MNEPILVIMAAGMGSRYGGLKQIDAMDEQGHIIMDFSLFDAYRAGFRRVVFIIKSEIDSAFREIIGNRMEKQMQVRYAYQKLTDLPEGFSVPEGRVKPWGTTHAVLSAAELLDAPFAVINADDYYGKEAFALLYQFLKTVGEESFHYAMIGYQIENTLTDNGSVARGVCELGGGDMLAGIRERTCIEKRPNGAAYSEDGGKTWTDIPAGNTVSMNMWGFGTSVLQQLRTRFAIFLKEEAPKNPLKSECYLPNVIGDMLKEGICDVRVLKTPDKWHGVTYQEDRPGVVKAIAELKAAGVYPETLWGANS